MELEQKIGVMEDSVEEVTATAAIVDLNIPAEELKQGREMEDVPPAVLDRGLMPAWNMVEEVVIMVVPPIVEVEVVPAIVIQVFSPVVEHRGQMMGMERQGLVGRF